MSTFIASALVAGFFILSGQHVVSAPAAQVEPTPPTLSVSLTSYNAVVGQTDSDPMTTASGLRSNPETIVARSSDLAEDLPFGTVIALSREGADTANCHFSKVESQIGYRVVGDAMNARMTNRIDVLLDQHDTVSVSGVPTNPSRVLGICDKVSIHVVGTVPLSKVPTTQEALREMIEGKEVALAK